LSALPSHISRGKNKTLGFAQPHWGTLPQTPSFELPNPSILEGLPRRLAGTNGRLFNAKRVRV